MIIGDNLGLNTVFGLNESFVANSWCRLCRVPNDLARHLSEELREILRNPLNYERDLKKNCSKLTGLKEPSVFNRIDGYHFCQNISVDPMHDLLEGVANYVMVEILTFFIYTEKTFTLKTLNSRLTEFRFCFENSNRPQLIKEKHLRDAKKLKMSASEMLCFVRYFGTMMGDLVSENYKEWTVYVLLRKIISIVMSPRVLRCHATVLQSLITEFNNLYFQLFGHLRPKFHLLTHYPRIMILMGPLVHLWNMLFESFNHQLKQSACATACKVNILETMAKKVQLKMAKIFFTGKIDSHIQLGPFKRFGEHNFELLDDMKISDLKSISWVTKLGTIFQVGTVIAYDIDIDDGPQFGEVTGVFVYLSEIFLSLRTFKELEFNEHYQAHEVVYQKKEILVNFNCLPDLPQCLLIVKNEKYFIVPRYLL